MTIRILIVVTLAVGLLAVGCENDTPPPPAPSTVQPDVTVVGPCLPKCGNVEQR